MRNIKDCYVKIENYNDFLYTKGSFYVPDVENYTDEPNVTIDCGSIELCYEGLYEEILTSEKPSGQNYRRIKDI